MNMVRMTVDNGDEVNAHRRTGNFFARGGGEPLAQNILASCPTFYETVEKNHGHTMH